MGDTKRTREFKAVHGSKLNECVDAVAGEFNKFAEKKGLMLPEFLGIIQIAASVILITKTDNSTKINLPKGMKLDCLNGVLHQIRIYIEMGLDIYDILGVLEIVRCNIYETIIEEPEEPKTFKNNNNGLTDTIIN